MKGNVEFCSGCVVRAFHSENQNTFETKQKFLSELRATLEQVAPGSAWDLCFTSCQRYCPEGRISTVIERQMRVAPGMSVESLADFLISNIKRFDAK